MQLAKKIPIFLLGSLFLVPFLFSNYFADPFEYPKVLVVRILIELLVLLYLLFYARKYSFHWDFWDFLAVFWVVVLLGSSYLAGNFSWSFWGGEFRHQGILTYIHLVALFMVGRRLFVETDRLKVLCLKYLVLSSTLQSLLVIIQFLQVRLLGLDLTTYSGRFIGTLGQPGFVGGFLAAGFGASLGLFALEKNKKYLIACFFLALGIAAAWSLGGILAIGVITSVFFVKTSKRFAHKIFYFLGLAILILIFLVIGLNKEKVTVNSYGQSRIESRLSIWPAAFNVFRERPFIGYGAENLGQVFPDKYGGSAIDRAHNAFLDRLIEGGVFLGSVYLSLTIGALFIGWKIKENLALFLAFVGVLVNDQVNVSGIVNLLLFWVLLSILLRHDEIASS